MGMVDILLNNAEPFEQIDRYPLTEDLMCNLVKIGQAVPVILYMYIAQE